LANRETIHYNQIKKLLGYQRVILPPSAAITGAIASVDRERGVWKAPANVGLQAVIAPVQQVTDEQQGRLNIDAETGKSINAIRSFTGKGTLVWGARTLAGNDNQWCYISVRRLFITIEESVKKATQFAVYEVNDASTWLKVKGMIDSYLYTLWQRGALRGTKAEEAYFVNVGTKTMTPDEILNGYLIVEIGLAAVRPAEFIILRFSHKVNQ
jgi:phage tail sheath protein FI